jgi:hypothetical protein
MTRLRAALLILLLAGAGWWDRPAEAQEPCHFVLGFDSLRDLVGADTVGDCLEDEHVDPASGNVEQQTSGGLLVWRRTDGVTVFTDGGTSWINGPLGLQTRPNTERFSWEKDPVQSADGPSAPSIEDSWGLPREPTATRAPARIGPPAPIVAPARIGPPAPIAAPASTPPERMVSTRPTSTPVPAPAPATGPTLVYPGNGGGPTTCSDGSISHSSGRGTCSGHGGIRH